MANGQAMPSPTSRDLLGLAVGLAGAAASITVMFLAMRAVMGVGGSCAEGGPYEIAVHCPQGSAAGLTFGIFALLGFWAVIARYASRVGGFWGAAAVLPWAGLFISLGWNFLEEGFSAGDPVGWLLGAMFWVMGFVPLAALLPSMRGGSRPSAAADAPTPPVTRRGFTGYGGPVVQPARHAPTRAATDGHAVREQLLASIARDLQAVETRSAAGITIAPGPNADAGRDTEALVAHLERLAELRRDGLLTEAEFESAKSAIVKALAEIE